MEEFLGEISQTLNTNGFPEKRVSLPTDEAMNMPKEKMLNCHNFGFLQKEEVLKKVTPVLAPEMEWN